MKSRTQQETAHRTRQDGTSMIDSTKNQLFKDGMGMEDSNKKQSFKKSMKLGGKKEIFNNSILRVRNSLIGVIPVMVRKNTYITVKSPQPVDSWKTRLFENLTAKNHMAKESRLKLSIQGKLKSGHSITRTTKEIEILLYGESNIGVKRSNMESVRPSAPSSESPDCEIECCPRSLRNVSTCIPMLPQDSGLYLSPCMDTLVI